MQRKNEPTGICHRLYIFIVNTIFSPTQKTLTTRHSRNSENDHQMLLQDRSRNIQDPRLVTSSEIVVEFRHEIDSNKQKKNDEISRVDILKPQEVQEYKIVQEFEATTSASGAIAIANGAKKTATIKENAEEFRKDSRHKNEQQKQQQQQTQQQQQQKDKNLSVSRDESKKHKVPRLLSVDKNINEKSDAFIRSKRAAMRKNYSHDFKDL